MYLYVSCNLADSVHIDVKIARESASSASFQHRENTGPQFIILFAYMRGGSSFAGNLLGYQPGVFYWYEFLWDVYNSMLSSDQMCTVPTAVAFDKDFKYLR